MMLNYFLACHHSSWHAYVFMRLRMRVRVRTRVRVYVGVPVHVPMRVDVGAHHGCAGVGDTEVLKCKLENKNEKHFYYVSSFQVHYMCIYSFVYCCVCINEFL